MHIRSSSLQILMSYSTLINTHLLYLNSSFIKSFWRNLIYVKYHTLVNKLKTHNKKFKDIFETLFKKN